MRGVNGCFICGKYHRTNTKHTQKQFTAEVIKLKKNHLRALLAVEDLGPMVHMAGADDFVEDEDDMVQLACDSYEEDSDLSFITVKNAAGLQSSLSASALLHGRSNFTYLDFALVTINEKFDKEEGPAFDGI